MFFIISQFCVSTPQSKFKMFYHPPKKNLMPISNHSPRPHLSPRKPITYYYFYEMSLPVSWSFSLFYFKYRSLVFYQGDRINRKDHEQNGKHKPCNLNQPTGNTWQIYINLISQTSVFFIIKSQWILCHLCCMELSYIFYISFG